MAVTAPTLDYLEGFEHQFLGSTLVAGGEQIWTVTANTVQITFVNGRHISTDEALQVAENGVATYVRKTMPTTKTICICTVAIRMTVAPVSTNPEVFGFAAGTGLNPLRLRVDRASNTWRARIEDATAEITGPTVVLNQWYVMQFKISGLSSGTWALDWSINGSSVGSTTRATAASTIDYIRFGMGGTDEGTFQYDDCVVQLATAVDPGTYPIEDHIIRYVVPDSDGTDSPEPPTSFTSDTAETTGPWWDNLGTFPVVNTKYVGQTTLQATHYIEVNFANCVVDKIVDVRGFCAGFSSGTSAFAGAKGYIPNGGGAGVDLNLVIGDFSDTDARLSGKMLTRPAGGWTVTDFNALTARMGHKDTGAAARVPRWGSFMLQYASPIPPVSAWLARDHVPQSIYQARAPVATGHVGYVRVPVAVPAPDLSWQGHFPSRIDFARSANEWRGLTSLGFPPNNYPRNVSWLSQFPAEILRPRSANEWGGFYVRGVNPLSPEFFRMGWKPFYPDELLPSRSANEWKGMSVLGYPPAQLPRNVPWWPNYPSLLLPPRSANEWSGHIAYVPAITRWGLDAIPWVSRYPDYIWRLHSANEWLGMAALGFPPTGFPREIPWLPRFPDYIWRQHSANEWLGGPYYQAYLAGFPLPTPLIWQGRFPAWIDYARSANEWAGRFALVSNPLSTDFFKIAWKSVYPDQLLPPRSANEWRGMFALGFPPTSFPREVPWWPNFPSQLLPPHSATEWQGHIGYVPAITRWGLDTIPWVSRYPDYIWRERSANEWLGGPYYQAYLAGFPVPGPVAWLPRHPDQLLPTPQTQLGWIGYVRFEAPAAPSIGGWKPTYPDYIWRAPEPTYFDTTPFLTLYHPNAWPTSIGAAGYIETSIRHVVILPTPQTQTGMYSFVPYVGSFPIPSPMAWQGEFPDQHMSVRPTPEGGLSYVRFPAEEMTALSWQGSFPSQLRLIEPPTPGWIAHVRFIPPLMWKGFFDYQVPGLRSPNEWAGGAFYQPNLGAFPIPGALAWKGVFPERIDVAPRGTSLLWTYGYVPAITRWGLDAMPWEPEYPSQFPPMRSANEWRGMFAYGEPSDVFVPRLSWKSTYPDEIRRPRSSEEWKGGSSLVVPVGQFAPDPMAWQPRYPNQFLILRSAEEWEGYIALVRDLGSFPLPAPLVWQGRFPEQFLKAQEPTPHHIGYVRAPDLVVPPLSWAPKFPAWFEPVPAMVEQTGGVFWRAFGPLWADYESFLEYDTTKVGSTVQVYFEAILEVDSGPAGARAYARCYNITDGVLLAGSEISTDASVPTRVRIAVTMPVGAKEYRAEIGAMLGTSITCRAARLIADVG